MLFTILHILEIMVGRFLPNIMRRCLRLMRYIRSKYMVYNIGQIIDFFRIIHISCIDFCLGRDYTLHEFHGWWRTSSSYLNERSFPVIWWYLCVILWVQLGCSKWEGTIHIIHFLLLLLHNLRYFNTGHFFANSMVDMVLSAAMSRLFGGIM